MVADPDRSSRAGDHPLVVMLADASIHFDLLKPNGFRFSPK